MSSRIPNRAASSASSAAAVSLPPLPSAVRVEHRGSAHGRVLVATRAFAAGEVILQEAPLVAVPPFDSRVEWIASAGAISSKPQRQRGWASVESLCKSLRFEDDALVLYRAVVIYSLLFLSAPARAQAQHSRAIAQRILELYDPARMGSSQSEEIEEDVEGISVSTTSSGSSKTTRASRAAAHRARTLSALTASLRTDAGRAALESLFACVAAQASASLGVPVVAVSVQPQPSSSGSTEASSSWDEQHFLSHVLPLADIFNGSNMDCIVAPLPAEATVSSGSGSTSGAASYTALYDALSRLNHDCLPNCVHYLELEEAYTAGKGMEQLGAGALTPQKLVPPAAASACASSTASSAPAASNLSRPFVRTLRALCPISAGDELSISYLSPQLLCQATHKRQAVLRAEWRFLCRCARCLSVDTARVLACPTCKTGSILMQCMPPSDAEDEEPESAAEIEAPFSFVSSCDCPLTAAQSTQLLKDESQVESEWSRFQSDLPRCTQPVQLCSLFSSLLRRNGISDSHWIAFEFHIVLRDLQRVLNKPLEEMEHAKWIIWFLERVGSRSAVQMHSSTDTGEQGASTGGGVLGEIARFNAAGKIWGAFTQSGLLIDTESRSYLPPSARVASLSVNTELQDAWLSFSDLLWSIHARQTDDLARMLIQRAIYFLACASIAAGMLSAEGSALRRSIQTKMQQRVQIARAKGVDLSKIVEEEANSKPTVSSAPPVSSATAAPAVASSSLACHSPVCPHNAFSAVRPPASLQCTRCKSVRYCSRDCQKVDWTLHKKVCKAPEQQN